MVRRSDAVVLATALPSYTQLTDRNGIETVIPISIDETIKGDPAGGSVINIVEPGGTFGREVTVIPGVPHLDEGERVLLFLKRTGTERWAIADLALGKFSFRSDTKGHELLMRDESEITGWDSKLQPYREQRRLADRFLTFVKEEAQGRRAAEDYFLDDAAPLRPLPTRTKTSSSLTIVPNIAPYTANSYTMLISGSMGGRWAVFPNPVNWFSGTTTEPGAPGGGATAINAAFTAWDNDCGSNVNYVYAGTDNGTHTAGLTGVDGANTILFERNLTSYGVSPFTCSGSGYSGTLGIGGVTNASGTNSVSGETFATITEGDVEMNQGIANCTLLFSTGDFNSAVTHEVGHTLGFRHSDNTRDGGSACTSDPTLECSNQAIMKSFISTGLNAALQAYDQHAVQAVYPGNVCAPGPTCTPPAITGQPAPTSITSGSSTTLSVTASGTTPLSYQWYVGSSGNTSSPVGGGTGASVNVSPTTTTNYWVRVSNSCGSADSTTATVTVVAAGGTATSLYLVTPCRIMDTRNPTGQYGGPALAAGAVRNVKVTGVCGISASAKSIAVNITVVSPGAGGWLTLFPGPAGAGVPSASTLNYTTNKTLANNAVLAVGSDGTINIYNSGPSAANFLIDVSGYFQ